MATADRSKVADLLDTLLTTTTTTTTSAIPESTEKHVVAGALAKLLRSLAVPSIPAAAVEALTRAVAAPLDETTTSSAECHRAVLAVVEADVPAASRSVLRDLVGLMRKAARVTKVKVSALASSLLPLVAPSLHTPEEAAALKKALVLLIRFGMKKPTSAAATATSPSPP
jgi:hypothetical protein